MPTTPSPETVWLSVPGGRVHTLQWGRGPRLLFTHATGMCARAYVDLLGPLGEMFRIIAADARGHGRTELPMDPDSIPTDWKIFRQDIVHIVDALGGGPLLLAGHSFGATTAFEAAATHPGLASAVCLIEPPFVPFALAQDHSRRRQAGEKLPIPLADQAARRRSHFDSRQAAHDRFQGRGVFHGWPESAFAGYIADGLRPDGDSVRLACLPAVESSVYRGISTSFESSIKAADFPITLLLGSEDSTVRSAEVNRIRELQPAARIERFSGTGHFLPVTHPQLIRPHLEALLQDATADR